MLEVNLQRRIGNIDSPRASHGGEEHRLSDEPLALTHTMRGFFVSEQVVGLLVDVLIEPLLVHMHDVVHGIEKWPLIALDNALRSPPQARKLVRFRE